jgi:sortase A
MWSFRKSTGGENEAKDGDARRQRRRAILIWVERILLVSGLGLVGFFGAARVESFFASRAALDKFATLDASSEVTGAKSEEAAHRSGELGPSEPMETPETDFPLWDERRVNAYKQSVGRQSGVPLAVLSIPKIGLRVPLFEGTDEITLNHAVGRIAGTARPGEEGNIGIAGHRDGFFRGLKDVEVGDAIELKTLKGTDKYIVDQITVVNPNQVDVLQPRGFPSLTLVTCYPFYFLGSAPQRYIVKASL